MLKENFLLSLGICCILLLSGNNCSRRETGLLNSVPSDSTALLVVNWSSVRNDNELKSLFNGNEFEDQIQRFGVESAAVAEFAVFSDNGTKAGLLMRGNFDRRKVIEHLKADGWSEDSADETKIYVKGEDYAALQQNGVLVGGTRRGVSAALQTTKNSRESIRNAGAFKKIKASMTGNKSPISAFLIAPEGTLEAADAALSVTAGAMSLFGYGAIGDILQKLNVAEGVGFTLAHGSVSQKYAVNLCVLMRDEKSALVAAGALNMMKSLSGMVKTPEAEELRDFDFARKEKVLSIKMEMPREALKPENKH
jgi:hypothetical protein